MNTIHMATLGYITQAITRLDRADRAMDKGDHKTAHMELLVARNSLRDLAPNDLLIPALEKMRKSA